MLSILVNVLLTLGSAMASVLMNPFSLGLMSFQYVSLLTSRHLSLSCMLQFLHAHCIVFQLQISFVEYKQGAILKLLAAAGELALTGWLLQKLLTSSYLPCSTDCGCQTLGAARFF